MKRRKHKLSKTGKPSKIEFDFDFGPTEKMIPDEGTFEKYQWDIKKYLVEDSWHYPEDVANIIVGRELYRIKEGFDKGESVESVAIDIGYCCG